MLTHAKINARFVALDGHPVLLSETFDGWLAWPIVKERLWFACLQTASGEAAQRKSPVAMLRRLGSGFAQLAWQAMRPQRGRQALFYEPRHMVLPDGRAVHPQLGTRPYDKQPAFRCVYGASGAGLDREALSDYGVGALLAALAVAVRRLRSVSAVAERMSSALADACPELPEPALRLMVADQLARFRLRAGLFRHLLRRAGVRSVIVLDPDGKVAEIAAARSLKLPVVEVQHGMFSAREPDYAWTALHRTLAAPLPLPDRILVFGALWREEILRAGYWTQNDVVTVRNPAIEAYRDARQQVKAHTGGGRTRILFATQGYVRAAAIAFWEEVLTAFQDDRATGLGLDLRIKVHPLEDAFRHEYEVLARRYPRSCTVVSSSVDAFDELLHTDLMVGYTSLMMLEATGVGVPAIGLRGGAAAEGFSATFGLPSDATGIEECASPDEFALLLRSGRAMRGPVRSVYDLNGPPVETALAAI